MLSTYKDLKYSNHPLFSTYDSSNLTILISPNLWATPIAVSLLYDLEVILHPLEIKSWTIS